MYHLSKNYIEKKNLFNAQKRRFIPIAKATGFHAALLVTKMKPNPEGYLKAMEYFKIKLEETIIFEDSDAGLEAAKSSGAFYYKVFRLNDGNTINANIDRKK